jgi:hypothetical protein
MPSTVIRHIDYRPELGQLVVTFTSGSRYAYFDVPREAYEAFVGAFSKGEHFSREVRDRYPYRRLDA